MREKMEMEYRRAAKARRRFLPHFDDMAYPIYGGRAQSATKTETGESQLSPVRFRADVFWTQTPPELQIRMLVPNRERNHSAMAYSAAASA